MFSAPEKKVLPKTNQLFYRMESFTVYVAQNATEACQISVLSKQGDRNNLQIKVIDNSGVDIKIELLREYYVSCEGALWPDPVVADDGCFDLQEWKNVTYRINISTTMDTQSGVYELKVVLYEAGKVYGEYTLWVHIWNFAINPENYMDTDFGINYECIQKVHNRLERLFPGYQMVVPHCIDPKDGNGVRAVDLLEKYNVVWCPKINLFKDDWLKYYMQERSKKGERTWWYCCWEPPLP